VVTPLTIEVIQKHLNADHLYQMRRHEQWTENYLLYRDTVITNRLTQRQSVNVPYMKETLRAYLSQTNNAPDNVFEELGNDKQKELYLNEYWADCMTRLKMKTLDKVDRKQEFLYGRSFMKLNIIDGRFYMEIIDPQDVLLDRFMNPWDLDSARRVTHTGIYRSLSDVKRNPMYDASSTKELEKTLATKTGLIKTGQNAQMAADKAKRMQDMGVPDVMDPVLDETYVELNELQVKLWDEARQEDVVYVVVTGESNQILMQKPMEEILNVNFFTFCTWASDVERTDVWSDGLADVVRPMNQVANVRWSQKVENGTLANFGMQFYDATKNTEWSPAGFQPGPFNFFPLAGPPKEVLMRVEVPEMEDIYQEQAWIKERIEGSTSTTAIAKGEEADGSGAQTLGEIQLLAQKAEAIAKGSSDDHKQYWQDIGDKFAKLVHANAESMNPVTLHKKNFKGEYYKKTLKLVAVKSDAGYKCKVSSKADKEADSLKQIQKLQIGVAQFPGNAPLQTIYQKKVLDWMGLQPEEAKEVMDFQAQMAQMAAPSPDGSPQGTPGMPPAGPGATPAVPPGNPGVTVAQVLKRQPQHVG
jgi:hypothetical protein